MSVIFKRGNAEMEANLTPMIDVVFLLIVFFVLVSQIVEVESVELDLPIPDDPRTIVQGEETRAVINVIPAGGGRAEGYRLAGQTFEAGPDGVTQLTERLTALMAKNPTITVNLRADRATHYRWIHPAMQAVSDAAASNREAGASPRVNLVVQRERDV